ncbi:peptide/nickel transport system substrate-binding protein [Natronorubrum daqingense]|uniref:ABC transporter substrate-binding protein n=2 Tax=Natronorubrum daqingense TaxID=588898 RepID=A0A1N6X6F4_9EURY|nr:ABC transporter substrate-binding protein [Natronorubrum daqingense]APX96035.1 ABC transporter substrate-binding protein [Natronorubrum daqingense]SIQ97821.1 peptide/nickel transport system substrate-binding protein [Natronorubrum daqingense]
MEGGALPTTRRGFIAGGSVAAVSSLAGCFDRLWSQAETTGPDQVTMSIKTVPADDDPLAATVANRLRENFTEAGIDASHHPIAKAELHREVLLEHDYDVFVVRHRGFDEYDSLSGLLHSQFVSERGWQNPFQFADLTVDDLLERQREASNDDRPTELVDLVEFLLEAVPYTVVAHPYRISGVQSSLEAATPPRDTPSYVDLLSDENNGSLDGRVELGVFGENLTQRLNPLTVDRNRIDGVLDLLYDPLVRQFEDDYVLWLAEDVEWDDDNGLRADVTLREGLEWHDGEPIDADDVAFTLELIEDTSLGDAESPIPAPVYRDQQLLVESTDVYATDSISISFGSVSRDVARRVFTIPLLPEHIWADRSEIIANRQTEVLASDNEEPIGSGLFAFEAATEDNEVLLEPFEAHVFSESGDRPSVLENFSHFGGLRYSIVANSGTMVDTLFDMDIDITASELPPEYVSDVQGTSGVTTTKDPSDSFYMIGYNNQHDELANPNFRRICSRLIDRETTVEDVFNDFGDPATTPAELVGMHNADFDDDDELDSLTPEVLNFPGSAGSIDTAQTRSLFEDIGYSYDDGVLLK